MIKRIALTSSFALLAACGDANEQTFRDSESGQSVTLRTAKDGDAGIAPPANLPDFAAIYPGGVITASVTANQTEAAGMVSFTTRESAEKLVEFYRAKGKAAGLAPQAEMNLDGTRIISMAKDGSNDVALQLTVSPMDEDSHRQVSLVYAAEKP